MLPFTEATTSIKGPRRTVELGPCTAFVGPNMSGKSAWLETVRLAITGKHPVGRAKAALVKLTLPNMPLVTEVTGPDAAAHFNIDVSKRGTVKGVDTNVSGALAMLSPAEREALFPTITLRELLTYGNKRAKEALFQRFGSMPQVLTPDGLTEEQQQIWEDAIDATKGQDAVDVLAKMGSAFRSMILTVGRDVNSLDAQIKEARMEMREIVEASNSLAELEALHDKAVAWETRTDPSVELAEQTALLAQYETEVQECIEEQKQYDAQAPEREAEMQTLQQELDVVNYEISQIEAATAPAATRVARTKMLAEIAADMVQHNVNTCPVCSHGTNAQQLKTDLDARKVTRENDYASQVTELDSLRRRSSALAGRISSASGTHRTVEQSLRTKAARAQNNALHCQAAISALRNVVSVEEYEGPSSAQIKQQMAELRKIDAKRIRISQDATRISALKARREAIKTCAREAEELLEMLLQTVATAAEDCVNRNLSEGFEAQLDLDKMMWLIKDSSGEFREPALQSGAMEAELAKALMLGWSEGAPIRIPLIDDEDLKGLDTANARGFMQKLYDLQQAGELTQVFVATNRVEDVPEGYNIIDVTTL